jgi:hypothetical protein
LEKVQSKLPLIVEALKASGKKMEDAANFIGSVQGEIGNALQNAGGKFNSMTIPKLELKTDGFMDAFMRSIRSVTNIPIHDPPEDVKNSINSIRVLTMLKLDGQTTPFKDAMDFFDLEGQTISGISESSKEALLDASKGLLEIAGLLEII